METFKAPPEAIKVLIDDGSGTYKTMIFNIGCVSDLHVLDDNLVLFSCAEISLTLLCPSCLQAFGADLRGIALFAAQDLVFGSSGVHYGWRQLHALCFQRWKGVFLPRNFHDTTRKIEVPSRTRRWSAAPADESRSQDQRSKYY